MGSRPYTIQRELWYRGYLVVGEEEEREREERRGKEKEGARRESDRNCFARRQQRWRGGWLIGLPGKEGGYWEWVGLVS